jgi:hypothetical protein
VERVLWKQADICEQEEEALEIIPIEKQMIFTLTRSFVTMEPLKIVPIFNVKNNVTRWREPFVEITFLKETQESSKTVDGPTARR